jgi:surface protein
MFYEDKNLKELNLTSFDTRNVTSASSMFYKTDNLQTIYV